MGTRAGGMRGEILRGISGSLISNIYSIKDAMLQDLLVLYVS